MAVWLFIYGKNGIRNSSINVESYTRLLNSIEIDGIKILDSIVESTANHTSIRKYYTDNKKSIEADFALKSEEEYRAYLHSIKMPYIEKNKLVDQFIIDGEKREKENIDRFNNVYEQFKTGKITSKWKIDEVINGTISFSNKLNYFNGFDGLRMSIFKDLIWLTGPFSVFSVYTTFQLGISAASREYYHDYFKRILHAFESDFILYVHEWTEIDEEKETGLDLQKLKAQTFWKQKNSSSIHDIDSYYYEEI